MQFLPPNPSMNLQCALLYDVVAFSVVTCSRKRGVMPRLGFSFSGKPGWGAGSACHGAVAGMAVCRGETWGGKLEAGQEPEDCGSESFFLLLCYMNDFLLRQNFLCSQGSSSIGVLLLPQQVSSSVGFLPKEGPIWLETFYVPGLNTASALLFLIYYLKTQCLVCCQVKLPLSEMFQNLSLRKSESFICWEYLYIESLTQSFQIYQ